MNNPMEVIDFSGGFTDSYLAGPANMGQLFDNLVIDPNKKAIMRFGSILRDSTAYILPSGNKRISHMWFHGSQMLEQAEKKVYYMASSSYAEIVGPSSNPVFSSWTAGDHVSHTFWNNHSFLVIDNFANPQKIFKDNGGTYHVINAGLPALASNPSIAIGSANTNNYIYGFLHYYTYNVEGVTFEMFGPITQVQVLNSDDPGTNPNSITGIPVLANGVTNNYDTSNIKINIYRTVNNLTTLLFIHQISNGTTTYTDNNSDASIINNVPAYITGGVLDNDPPPQAKYIAQNTNIALYGNVKESGVVSNNRIRQSIPGQLDSCPTSLFDDYPEEIMGIGVIQNAFIVFCKNSHYRVDNFFDELGNGGLTKLRISDTIGLVSHDSIVNIDEGIVFAGTGGWYFCDGYKTTPIATHLNTTYGTITATAAQARNIWGTYDKLRKRVWWAAQKSASSLDNDSCYILDLRWGLSTSSTFTSASNGTSFAPSCVVFDIAGNGTMYRADKRGYVFTHTDSYYADPRVDLLTNAPLWTRKTIIYDYKSCAFNFGTTFVRKFVPKILATFMNITNLSAGINSINDDGRQTQSLTEVRYTSNITWGDPDVTWGQPLSIWNSQGLIEAIRNFPAKGLRCDYKQIEITNSYTIVANSDVLSQGTIDNTFKTLTLTNSSSAWPVDVVDYYVSFENDLYVKQYQVSVRNSATQITFLDSANVAPINGTYKWLLKGYWKNQAIGILSYVIHYKMLTPSQPTFKNQSSATGSNA